jgi:uncharacterized protein YjiS (DUF1127 family)
MSLSAFLSTCAGAIRAVARALAEARRRRLREKAINALMRLDDRTLADIGMHRSEIRSAVIEASDVYVPRERRHSRVPAAPRQASWQGAPVRPLKLADANPRPANEPTEPRRSA